MFIDFNHSVVIVVAAILNIYLQNVLTEIPKRFCQVILLINWGNP